MRGYDWFKWDDPLQRASAMNSHLISSSSVLISAALGRLMVYRTISEPESGERVRCISRNFVCSVVRMRPPANQRLIHKLATLPSLSITHAYSDEPHSLRSSSISVSRYSISSFNHVMLLKSSYRMRGASDLLGYLYTSSFRSRLSSR
jgi:hypothetical protein